MAERVDVSDLLGLSYEQGEHFAASGSLDCAGCVLEVLRRLGWRQARMELLLAIQGRASTIGWERIPSVSDARVGDVILQDVGKDQHLLAVVSTAPVTALSAFRGVGVRLARGAMLRGGEIYRPPHA